MPLISLSQSVDLYEGFSSRAKYYGSMAAKRLQTMHYANIAAAIEVEKKVPTDSMDQITRSIIWKPVVACVQDLPLVACVQDLLHQNSASKIVDLVVTKITAQHGRRSMPSISSSRSVDSDDESCTSRADFNGVAAVNRIKTYHSMSNIAVTYIEIENDVPPSSIGRMTESIILQHLVDEEVPPAACAEITDSVRVTGQKVKQRRRTIWSRTKKFFARMVVL